MKKIKRINLSRARYEALTSTESRCYNLEDELKGWRAEYARLSQTCANLTQELALLSRDSEKLCAQKTSEAEDHRLQVVARERAMAKLIEQKERDGQTIASLVRLLEQANGPSITLERGYLADDSSLRLTAGQRER